MSSLDGMTQYCVRCEQDALGRKATIVGVQHTCGQQPREAPQAGGGAGALPGVNEALSDIEQVSADLEDCSSLDLNEWGDRVGEALEVIRTHLSQLTAERDALLAEVVRLNSVGAAKTSTIAALCDTADEIERQARLDALRWGKATLPSLAVWPTGLLIHRCFEAEIARLERLTQPPPSEADALREQVKLLSADSPDAAAWLLADTANRARLDALRWVCSQAMCADWHDLGERIKAEIARLESNA